MISVLFERRWQCTFNSRGDRYNNKMNPFFQIDEQFYYIYFQNMSKPLEGKANIDKTVLSLKSLKAL